MIGVRAAAVAVVLLGAAAARAGGEGPGAPVAAGRDSTVLTGNLGVDFFGLRELQEGPRVPAEGTAAQTGQKSPWLAAGLSLVVPGAGELYAGSYVKAAAFFLADVALWTLAYVYDKKGDRQTDSFQGYADQGWSVVRYAEWTLANTAAINPRVNPADYAGLFLRDASGTTIGVDWYVLNDLERDLGGWYSHVLPPYGEQQYFELIGKYPQYTQGWNDANPAWTTYDQNKAGTPNMQYYSGQRGQANTYYTTATTFVTIAVVNHVLSAVDAAWTTATANRLHAQVGMQVMPDGRPVPVATLFWGF